MKMVRKKNERYCIVCDVQIKKPSILEMFGDGNTLKPVKFREGFMCGYCYKKKYGER